MSTEPFKVGDSVAVVHRASFGLGGSVSKPLTIAKIHKGNGNVIVDGTQFRADSGFEVGYGRRQIVRVGSSEHQELLADIEKLRLVNAVRNALGAIKLDHLEPDSLRGLLGFLRPLMPAKEPTP